jgi:hypothetical protein
MCHQHDEDEKGCARHHKHNQKKLVKNQENN